MPPMGMKQHRDSILQLVRDGGFQEAAEKFAAAAGVQAAGEPKPFELEGDGPYMAVKQQGICALMNLAMTFNGIRIHKALGSEWDKFQSAGATIKLLLNSDVITTS
jgi:hypothetical protein